jgi:hypothetical protein
MGKSDAPVRLDVVYAVLAVFGKTAGVVELPRTAEAP